MKNRMKILALALMIVMTLSVFGACNTDNGNTTSSATTTGATTTGATTTAAQTEEPIKLKILGGNSIGIMNTKDTDVEKYIEEKFNVEIDLIDTVDIHNRDSWNLYWASGNMPDASYMNNTLAAFYALVNQGFIRTIPEGYLESYMPDWMNNIYSLVSKEMCSSQIRNNNGEIMSVPFTNYSYNTPYIMGARKDWMDKLGIESVPTTLDELHDLAYAFTFDDPDGNGVDDTYGFLACTGRLYMRFGYVHTAYDCWPNAFYQGDDGKVYYTSTTDKYKETLQCLNSWFEEGIIDPEFATADRDQQRMIFADGRFGIITDHPTWFFPTQQTGPAAMLTVNNPDSEMVYFGPVSGPYGDGWAQQYFPGMIGDANWFFGANCSDEQMIKWMQILNSLVADEEYFLRITYGIEGETYDFNEFGNVVPNNDIPIEQKVAMGISGAWGGRPMNFADAAKYAFTPENQAIFDVAASLPKSYVDYNFSFPGENASYTTLYSDIQDITLEYYYNAIMGKANLTSDWDAYIANLYAAGLQTIIDEYDAGLNG